MNRTLEIIKQNPWKITIGTIITVVISVGSFYLTDIRYVKKVEYEEHKAFIEKFIKENQELIEKSKKQ